MKENHLSLWEAVQNHSFQIISIYLIIIMTAIIMCVIVAPIVHNVLGYKVKDIVFNSLLLITLITLITTIIIGKKIYDNTQKTYVSGKDTVKVTVTANAGKLSTVNAEAQS